MQYISTTDRIRVRHLCDTTTSTRCCVQNVVLVRQRKPYESVRVRFFFFTTWNNRRRRRVARLRSCAALLFQL